VLLLRLLIASTRVLPEEESQIQSRIVATTANVGNSMQVSDYPFVVVLVAMNRASCCCSSTALTNASTASE